MNKLFKIVAFTMLVTSLVMATSHDSDLTHRELETVSTDSSVAKANKAATAALLKAGKSAQKFLATLRGDIDVDKIWVYLKIQMNADSGEPVPKDVQDYVNNYGTTVIAPAAIAIAFVVLTILWFIGFFCGRCVCGGCGGKYPPESRQMDGYTGNEKCIPFVFFILFGLVSVGCAVGAALFIGGIGSGATNLKSSLLLTLGNTTSFASNVVDQVENIKETLVQVKADVNTQLGDTSFIDAGVNGLLEKTDAFVGATTGVVLPEGCISGADDVCVPCDFCTEISKSMKNVNSKLKTDVKPQLDSLVQTKQVVVDTLGAFDPSLLDSAIASGNQGVYLLSNASISLEAGFDIVSKPCGATSFEGCTQRVIPVAQLGLAAYAVLFVLSVLGVIFAWLSRRLSCCLWISWCCTILVMLLGFILAAVMLPAAVVMSDGCIMLASATDPNGPGFDVLLNPQNAKLANAFFQDTPVLAALNMTSSFAFSDSFKFPKAWDPAAFNFQALNDLKAKSATLTPEQTFAFPQDKLDKALKSLNDAAGGCFGENIPDGCKFTGVGYHEDLAARTPPLYPFTLSNVEDFNQDGVKDAKDKTDAMAYFSTKEVPDINNGCKKAWSVSTDFLKVKSQLGAKTADIKTRLDDLDSFLKIFNGKMDKFSDGIAKLQTESVGSVIKAIDGLKKADCGNGVCQFVKDDVNLVNAALCGEIMTSFLFVGVCFFFASLVLYIPNFTMICLAKRLGSMKAPVHVGQDVQVRALS